MMPPYPDSHPDDKVSFSNNSQDVLTLNFGPDVQLIPITDEPEISTEPELNDTATEMTEIQSTETTPEKEYKDKDVPEKKKDKTSQKLEKLQSKYNIIVSTSSEVNEKFIDPTTSSNILESMMQIVAENISTSVNSSQETTMGIGEATPVLDSSMVEAVASTMVDSDVVQSSSSTPTESLPSTTISTMNTEKTTIEETKPTEKEEATGFPYYPYRPRPGIVLDDTEYKPGGHRAPPIITARPPIGEIFDVTVSAIQGLNGGSGSAPGKPVIYPVEIDKVHAHQSVITAPSGTEGFVSIDGKRTYLNLFGDDSSTVTVSATKIIPTTTKGLSSSITATGYAVAHSTEPSRTKTPVRRPGYNRRPSQPPVR